MASRLSLTQSRAGYIGTSTSANPNDGEFIVTGKIGIGATNISHKLTIEGDEAGDGSWVDGILIKNTNSTTGESAISFNNQGTGGTGTNYWIQGLNQSNIYKMAYGTSFTDGNTKLEIATNGALKLNTYGQGFLQSDANGNIALSGGGTLPGGPYLPLSAGSGNGLTGQLWFTGTTDASRKIFFTNAGTYAKGFMDAGGYGFQVSGSEKLTIDSSGNVGIGTTSTAYKLDVNGNLKTSGSIRASTASFTGGRNIISVSSDASDANSGISFYDSAWQAHIDHAGGDLKFLTGGTNERMRIGSGGSVSVNATTHEGRFLINQSDLGPNANNESTNLVLLGNRHDLLFKQIRTAAATDWNSTTLRLQTRVDSTLMSSIDFVTDSSYNRHIDINTASNTFNTRFTHDGNVGIGTTSPSGKFEIKSSATNWTTAPAITFTDNAGVADSRWIVGNIATNYGSFNIAQSDSATTTTYTPRITILDGGNVGIGTTNPDKKLSVDGGSIKLNHNNANAAYYLWLNKKEGQDGGILLQRDNSLDWQITNLNTTGDLNFYSYGVPGSVVSIQRATGNVGIGTTNPDTTLTVKTGTSAGLAKISSDGNGARYSANGDVQLFTNNSAYSINFFSANKAGNLMRILDNGNVGIGTTNPERALHIDANAGRPIIQIDKGGDKIFNVGTGTSANDDDNTILQMYDEGTEKVRLFTVGDSWLNGGNVGIGTTNPSEALHIYRDAASSEIRLHNSTISSYLRSQTDNLNFWVADGEKMRITSGGNVGIGETSPTSKLSIKGSQAAIDITRGTAGDSKWEFSSDSTAMYISEMSTGTRNYIMTLKETNGNVGIGTTSPDEKLEVVGSLKVGNIKIQNAVTGRIGFNRNTSTGAIYNSNYSAYQINGPTTSTGSLDIQSYNTAGSLLGIVSINSGNVTATNFILSSDASLKEDVNKLNVKVDAKWKSYKFKDEDEIRYGVIAQELEETNPELVKTDDKGLKSVKYIDLLIAKIAELEARLEKAGL